MSSSPEDRIVDIEYGLIEEDAVRDFEVLMQRLSIETHGLRQDFAPGDAAAQVVLPGILISGYHDQYVTVTSARPGLTVIEYPDDGRHVVKQLAYVDGALWQTTEQSSGQITPGLEGARLASAMAVTLQMARQQARQADLSGSGDL